MRLTKLLLEVLDKLHIDNIENIESFSVRLADKIVHHFENMLWQTGGVVLILPFQLMDFFDRFLNFPIYDKHGESNIQFMGMELLFTNSLRRIGYAFHISAISYEKLTGMIRIGCNDPSKVIKLNFLE